MDRTAPKRFCAFYFRVELWLGFWGMFDLSPLRPQRMYLTNRSSPLFSSGEKRRRIELNLPNWPAIKRIEGEAGAAPDVVYFSPPPAYKIPCKNSALWPFHLVYIFLLFSCCLSKHRFVAVFPRPQFPQKNAGAKEIVSLFFCSFHLFAFFSCDGRGDETLMFIHS